ncbi:hypothetical protein FKM82_028974 [Ascaphus truei]
MQYDKSQKNVANTTICPGNKPPEKTGSGTPTRRSILPQRFKAPQGVAPIALDASLFSKDDLQSTLLEGHRIARPDLDLSVINNKPTQKHTPKSQMSAEQRKPKKESTPINIAAEEMVDMIESQTLLFTYLTMKMQKNLNGLEEKAERNLLLVSAEKDNLQEKVYKLKRELLLLRREQQLNDVLEKQTEALTPSIAAKEQFKDDYKTFAAALDCTRHQLPIKNIHIVGNRQQYLEELEKHLATTMSLLEATTPGENAQAFGTIKELEEVVLRTDAELARSFRHILDLSFNVSKEISLQNQKLVEETCGPEAVKQWYFDGALP